jgi:hypothetical protein
MHIQIQTLRTALLLSDTAFSRLIEIDFVETEVSEATPFRRIAYKRMKRFERGEVVVLHDMEKRSIAESTLEDVVQFLMVQPTASFVKLAVELKEWASERPQLWKCPVEAPSLAERLSSVLKTSGKIDEAIATVVAQEDEAFRHIPWEGVSDHAPDTQAASIRMHPVVCRPVVRRPVIRRPVIHRPVIQSRCYCMDGLHWMGVLI